MVSRRIDALASHLGAVSLVREHQLCREACAKTLVKHAVNVSVLSSFMAGGYQADREKVFRFFIQRPDLQTPVELSKDEHRDLTMKQLTAIVKEGGLRPMQYLMEDPAKYFVVTEAVGYVDLSLGIKLGVQYRYSDIIKSFELVLLWLVG